MFATELFSARSAGVSPAASGVRRALRELLLERMLALDTRVGRDHCNADNEHYNEPTWMKEIESEPSFVMC